jgi:hypothetical protein
MFFPQGTSLRLVFKNTTAKTLNFWIKIFKLHQNKYHEIVQIKKVKMPIPVAVQSKTWVYGRSLTRIVGSNPTGGMDVCLLWVLCVVR